MRNEAVLSRGRGPGIHGRGIFFKSKGSFVLGGIDRRFALCCSLLIIGVLPLWKVGRRQVGMEISGIGRA